ncbi:MAG: S41 family peptidase [Planctomycetota bacterium]
MLPHRVFLLPVVAVVGLAGTSGVAHADENPPPAETAADAPAGLTEDEFVELFREFVDTVDQIDRNFVRDIDRRELIEAAIRGMVDELDPYSSYVPPRAVDDFTESIERKFGGVGMQVQVEPRSRRLIVFSPLPGTPAYRAGVQAGDVIVSVEGESTDGMTLRELTSRLKGDPGEAVAFSVVRRGQAEPLEIEVVREVIRVPTILGARYRPDGKVDFAIEPGSDIGYVRLTNFTRRTGRDLRVVVQNLVRSGTRGLVLDLRGNPGGLLDQAVAVCDLFLEEGVIVSTAGRNVDETVWRAKAPGTLPDIPLAVLVNRFSASASEIVSACLQDAGRAVVVGERTFGKGSVQTVIPLKDGKSVLKLTTAAYRRPSGANIHRFPDAADDDEWGVTPNEGFEDFYSNTDLASLLRQRRDRELIPGLNAEEAASDDEGAGETEEDAVPFVDRHLETAIDYIRGELAAESPDQAAERPAA